MEDKRWYKVTVEMQVLAEDENNAIRRVASLVLPLLPIPEPIYDDFTLKPPPPEESYFDGIFIRKPEPVED